MSMEQVSLKTGPRILIVEDHEAVRKALVALVSDEYRSIDEVDRGDTAMEAARIVQPDVILLDISLPGIGGLRLLPQLRVLLPRAVIVMVTNSMEDQYRKEALLRGADDYVDKSNVFRDLLPAIRLGLQHRSAFVRE